MRKLKNILPYLIILFSIFSVLMIFQLNLAYDHKNYSNMLVRVFITFLVSVFVFSIYMFLSIKILNSIFEISKEIVIKKLTYIHLPFFILWLSPLHLSLNRYLPLLTGILVVIVFFCLWSREIFFQILKIVKSINIQKVILIFLLLIWFVILFLFYFHIVIIEKEEPLIKNFLTLQFSSLLINFLIYNGLTIAFILFFIILPGYIIFNFVFLKNEKKIMNYNNILNKILIFFILGFTLFVGLTLIFKFFHISFYFYYFLILLSLIFLIFNFLKNKRLDTGDIKILIIMFLSILFTSLIFKKYLYIHPPFFDEVYRANFVVGWKFLQPFKNILFIHAGKIKYYTLGEFTVAQMSNILKIDWKNVYFFALPFVVWCGIFYLVVVFVKKVNSFKSLPFYYIILIPFLFFVGISFYMQAFAHFFLRQTVLGLFFSLLTIYLYERYLNNPRIINFLLIIFSVLFTFYSKALIGWILVGVLIGVHIIVKNRIFVTVLESGIKIESPRIIIKDRTLKEKLMFIFFLFLFSFLFNKFFLGLGARYDSIGLLFAPFKGFLEYKLYNIEGIYNYIIDIFHLKNIIFKNAFFTFITVYLIRYNFQLILFFYTIKNYILNVIRDKGLDKKSVIPVFLVSMFILNFIAWFVIKFKNNTGAAESYWNIYAIYYITILSIVILPKFLKTINNKMILVLIILTLGGMFNFKIFLNKRNLLPYYNNISFFKTLEYIKHNTPQDSVVLHNLYNNYSSIYISVLSEREQIISFLPYYKLKDDFLKKDKEEIDNWFKKVFIDKKNIKYPFKDLRHRNVIILYKGDKKPILNGYKIVFHCENYYVIKKIEEEEEL